MRAALHTSFGPASLLKVVDVESPVPGRSEVLVKVFATTVSTGDCNMRNFTFVTPSMRPIAHLMFGFRRPWKPRILGTELAGEVISTGAEVSRFKAGDRVYASTGMACGGHAQYACLPEDGAIALVPESMSYEQAVALPFGANTALYFLRDLGRIEPGHEVLVIGGSGSIGTAAVQLARHFGATVTGVCSGRNVELVWELGAASVIDYTAEDFTKSGHSYDLILDTVGASSFGACRSSLKPRGTYLQVIMSLADMLIHVPLSALRPGRKHRGGVAMESRQRFAFIDGLARTGSIKPVIDRTFKLEQIAEAFSYVESGHKRGNVVVIVEH